jgi:hypothetical protein
MLYLCVYNMAGNAMADTGSGALRANRFACQSLRAEILRPVQPEFHAECDVAAVVYGAADNPDAVLAEFVHDLRAQGFDAIGLLQRRNPCLPDISGPVEFFLIPDEDTQRACWEPQSALVSSCGTQLQDLAARLEFTLERRPHIIVLNRFGWLEASGSGLLSLLAGAIERDVPVAIAVPEGLFDRWLTVAQGLAVRLRCDRVSLDRWWDGVRRGCSAAGPHAAFCERYK